MNLLAFAVDRDRVPMDVAQFFGARFDDDPTEAIAR